MVDHVRVVVYVHVKRIDERATRDRGVFRSLGTRARHPALLNAQYKKRRGSRLHGHDSFCGSFRRVARRRERPLGGRVSVDLGGPHLRQSRRRSRRGAASRPGVGFPRRKGPKRRGVFARLFDRVEFTFEGSPRVEGPPDAADAETEEEREGSNRSTDARAVAPRAREAQLGHLAHVSKTRIY